MSLNDAEEGKSSVLSASVERERNPPRQGQTGKN